MNDDWSETAPTRPRPDRGQKTRAGRRSAHGVGLADTEILDTASEAPPEVSLVGQHIRQFRITELLGRGGMGELYIGFDEKLRRQVAIKTLIAWKNLDEQARVLFLREAQILSQLEHPHICRIYEYIEGESNDFLVLELIRGTTLRQAIGEKLDEAVKLRIAEQVAQGLAAAHAKGVAHCDLKPANIMLTERGEAKILDFGIAYIVDLSARRARKASGGDESGDAMAWNLGGVFGTLGYMSPEQANGKPLTATTDVFAFGLLMQELFTGNPVYDLTRDDALARVRAGQTSPPRGLSPDLTTLIRQTLAIEPEVRPTAAEVAEKLRFVSAVHGDGWSSSAEASTEVTSESDHLMTLRGRDPSPDVELVGRREELDLLLGRWRIARGGEGQVTLLVGGVGMGKSRLVRELGRRLDEDGVSIWNFFGFPDISTSPFQPLIRALRLDLRLDASEDLGIADDTEGLRRLEGLVGQLELKPMDIVPYLAPLLNLPLGERYLAPDLGPDRLRGKIQQALLSLVLSSAERQPRVMVVEDLNWLDPSTLEVLRLLLEEVETVPLLMVLTLRPDFEAPWRNRPELTQILLRNLDPAESAELVKKIAGDHPIATEVRHRIVTRTDGVPLFIEELTRAFLEDPAESLELPATLRDSLTARLDRLGGVKQVAQVAAVVGRTFSLDVLSQVTGLEPEDLRVGIDRLVRSGLVLRKGYGTGRRYSFKHALVQETAYDSLLPEERQLRHGRLADILWEMPEMRDRMPEHLAHHLTAARQFERAVDQWLAAGDLAISRSAHREGVVHLKQGLRLIPDLPPKHGRDRRELALLTKIAAASGVLHGYAAPEVEQTWDRAQELCSRLTDSPRLFWVVWGLWSFHLTRADLAMALDLGQRLLRIADAEVDFDLKRVALNSVGLAHYFLGDLEPALEHFDQAAHFEDGARDKIVASATGQDAGVLTLASRALVLWHLGRGSEAVRASDEAIALAQRLGHSYSLAFAHVYAARLHQSRRDLETTAEHARAVITLSEEKGYFWLTQGQFFLGWATEDMALMTDGLNSYQAAGARLSLTYMRAQVARLHLAAGRAAEARLELDDAFEAMESSSERFWEAELRRLRDKLLEIESRSDRLDPIRS